MTYEQKKLCIKTYGCQMNVYDSIKMGDLLKPHGYGLIDDYIDADLVILNTCHIREKAAEKVYSELGKIREEKERLLKFENRKMYIVVAGCVAQAEGDEIIKRAPFVDIVVGPHTYYNLPKLIESIKRENKWEIDINIPHESKFDKLLDAPSSQGISAFLSIQEGCDKFCNFCVVPYTRGEEYSRTFEEIYREAITLVSNGSSDITLLGQNVSGYHGLYEGQTISIGKLIEKLSAIDGLRRIRYMTSHPNDMLDSDLFEAHRDVEKLMPFLHLPVQSGSNRILEAMNRKHTREFYLEAIAKFRSFRNDMAFSSDFIVGYPGESEKDFEDTVKIIEEVGFAQCFSFKYSPRPGTPASMLDNQVPEKVKDERLAILQAKIRDEQVKFNNKFLGVELPVLLEKPGRYEGQLQGKSPYMQTVVVSAPSDCIGRILR
jgi:tRNA-2-methylthio-N6-dimethylallyladenosine synthase